MTKYEVQTFMAYDWENIWHIHNPDGTSELETFDSFTEAWDAVLEFLDEIKEEIALGQREPDEGYSIDEFRVWPVENVAHG